MLKHYVEFSHQGAFFYEETIEEAPERDPYAIVVPKTALCFRFYDYVAGEKPTEKLNISGHYYPDGKVFTAKEAEKLFSEQTILLSNIRSNKIEKVVRHRFGGFNIFSDNDRVINFTQVSRNLKLRG